MNAQHTPGPWTHNGYGYIHGNGRTLIAEIVNEENSNVDKHYCPAASKEEQAANTALVIAAPDLLESLRWAADKLHDVAEWSKANCDELQARSVKAIEGKARESIARAEGGTP